MIICIMIYDIFQRSAIILKNKKIEPHVIDAIDYYDLMLTYTEELRILQKELRRRIK